MKISILSLLILITISSAYSQDYELLENHRRTSDTTVYYIDLNSNFGDLEQIAFHGGRIGVLFDDKFGSFDTVSIRVEFPSIGEMSTFSFNKKFGTNQWILEELDFTDLDSLLNLSLFIVDDMGKEYVKNLILDPESNSEDITAKIIKTPIVIDCKSPVNTRIEFFSDVTGGKAPYLVEWRFSDNSKSISEVIPIQGFSSAILVDLPPPYYIGLRITDSCGEVSIQTVQVACDTSSPNYNSILFSIDPSKRRVFEK